MSGIFCWNTCTYDTYVQLKNQKYNELIVTVIWNQCITISLILLLLTDFSSLVNSFITNTSYNHINIRVDHEGCSCSLKKSYMEIMSFVLCEVPCYFEIVYWNYTKVLQKCYTWLYCVHITFLKLYSK